MKSIKISYLILTLVILFSSVIIPVSAEENAFTVTADRKTAFPGDEVTIDIKLSNNPGIAAFLLYVDYGAGLKLDEIIRGDIISDGFFINAETIDTLPQRLYWANGAGENMSSDGIYGSLKFTVPEDAEVGHKYPVYIYCYEKDLINLETETLTPVFIHGGIAVDDPSSPGSVTADSIGELSYEPPANPNAAPGSSSDGKDSAEEKSSTSPIELVKSFFFGIVQGITEWLPISSTGHMILFDEFVTLSQSPEFKEMFFVVIQFGSILAVLTLYRKRLLPFGGGKTRREKNAVWSLWGKIVIAAIPAAVVGVLFDDWLDKHFYNAWVVSVALIVYGILFIVIERAKKGSRPRIDDAESIDAKTALGIGAFQILSLIPGTSRSGSTIIGAMLLGVSRTAAAEFSFFLALPIMAGASLLKLIKFGFAFTTFEILVLLVGMAVAFVVSLIAIRFLVSFVRRHSFEAFGWYRIILGIIVILYFVFR